MTKHSRLIDVKWLKESLHNFFTGNFRPISEDDIIAYIDAASTIETKLSAQPEQKVGKWEAQKGVGYRCSECGRYALGNYILVAVRTPYCPFCGKKMEEWDEISD